MSRIATRTRLPLRLLTGTFGVLLLTYLVRRVGPAELLKSMATLGWGLALVIAWGGVSHLVKTWAWRLTLLDEKHHASFPRMLGLRLASEAVGQLGALGQLFGDTLRVSLLGPTMPLASGITSVTLDRALFIISAAVVSLVGLVAVLVVLPLPHTLSLYAGVFVFILAAVLLVAALAVKKRWPVFSGPARILARIRYLSARIERKLSLIHSVEDKLLDFYHHTPGAFWGSFALNMACHVAAVLEVYLILWLMGAKISLFAALAIEALTKLVSIVGTFNPGNVGTYEGGTMLIVKMLGLSAAAGLTLAFTRRVRAIFWAAVGGLCLVLLSKSRRRRNSDERTRDRIPVTTNLTSPRGAFNESELAGRSTVAVILANHLDGDSSFWTPLPRVGALPVLLRAILGAQKAGARRIVVVVDRVTGPGVKRDLLNTGRLPGFVEWVELGGEGTSLPSFLEQLVDKGEERLVLIAGDRTYHPSLHRRADEWDGRDDALALTTGSQLVGISVLSREAVIDLSKRCLSNLGSLEDLHARLASTHSVQCDPVPEDMWQRVLTPQQRLLAEQKLNHWLVKPTDGIFARTNRRISIPISRQIIRFPITPNMVSLFTLVVSFAGGLFFSFGGYLNMLTGAFLGLFASILDGCDGEVARLKLQQSDFGCWLETICDYLYYLFTFVGMSIGLFRNSGQRSYLVWGGLLLFGAVADILITGLQRHQLASGRPEQYLGIWQAQADSRRSNPLLYIGRHLEFIVRRCFLPYALLFFALFNITNLVFILSAVGSNVVWPIALYSYLTFNAVKGSTAASPAASAWERVDLIRQSNLG